MKRSSRSAALWVSSTLLFAASTDARVLHVDPNSKGGDDRYRSVAEALARTQSGDTVSLASGVYREAIDLRTTKLTRGGEKGSKVTRIEAAPNAIPLIKGSDVVEGWERTKDDLYVKRGWTVNSQQLFVDGEEFTQIGGTLFDGFPNNPKHKFASLHSSQGGIWPGRKSGGVSELTNGSFFYDSDKHALYVKASTDIRKQEVEVSVRPYLVFGERHNDVEIRGLRFAHANTTAVGQSGALSLTGDRIALNAVHVEHVDGSGVDLTGNDIRVEQSSANYCGIVGMKVRGRNAKLSNNETNYNNTRGFNKWWEAGGAKFVGDGGLQDSEIAGHRAIGNHGDGLWFDWHNDNNRVHGVIAAYNEGMGIHYEASRRARIYDNYVFGNGQRGIYLANASHSIVAHNLVAANGLEGIVIVDDRRAEEKGPPELVPVGNRVTLNVIGWNEKPALILPRSPDNESDANVFVGPMPSFSRGWPSREAPIRSSLDAWQKAGNADLHSARREMPMPEKLRSQLERRDSKDATPALWDFALLPLQQLDLAQPLTAHNELHRQGKAPGPSL